MGQRPLPSGQVGGDGWTDEKGRTAPLLYCLPQAHKGWLTLPHEHLRGTINRLSLSLEVLAPLDYRWDRSEPDPKWPLASTQQSLPRDMNRASASEK